MGILIETSNKSINFHTIFQKILWIIPLGILGNILFSYLTTDKSILDSLKSFSLKYLILALFLGLIPWFTNTLRVIIWTRFLGRRFKFSEIFSIILGAELGSAISPTAIGGGYIKLGMLFQKGLSAGTATSLTLLGSLEEFFFFLLSIPMLFFFSSIFNFPIDIRPLYQFKTRISNIPILIFVLFGFILIGFLFRIFYLKRDTKGRLRKVVESGKKLINDFISVYKLIAKNGKSRFLLTLFLASIHWTARFSIIFTVLAGFQIPFNPLQLFLFQWIVFSLMMLTPTPGGSGGAEASFYFVYGAFIPESMLGLATAGWRLLTYYFQLILASIFFSLFYYKTLEKKQIQ